jgi:hypothetical protein
LNSRLAVNWARISAVLVIAQEFFSPTKQPPLPPGIQPVKVKEIWSKDENFGWSQLTAIAVHGMRVRPGVCRAVVLALLDTHTSKEPKTWM